MTALKMYLPLFLLAYLLVTFVIPTVRVYHSTGINPVTFGSSDNAHDYIGFIMKILTALLIIAVLLFSFSESAYAFLNPFSYLEKGSIRLAGLFIVHAALVWIVIAQAQMKQSWRIGIDEKNQTRLVTHGLFQISRNPVFLGMMLSTIGMFLIIPNAITFFVAATSYIIIQVQIRLEEVHLFKQHGEQYEAYRKQVRRLV